LIRYLRFHFDQRSLSSKQFFRSFYFCFIIID
jgi:hypothetical protein